MTPDTQLFHDVFDASPLGIAVENLDGQPLFVNPAFCSMLGFNEQELRSKHCLDFSLPEDAEKDWTLFQRLRSASIDHYQVEKRYFRRDGSLVWGRVNIWLLNSRPSPLVVAVVEDITEKKLAEEAQLRYSAIVESCEDAVISKNLDAAITSWNSGAQHIFGYNQQEAIGKPITILIPPELLDEEQEILGRLKAGERIGHYETVRVTKAGERVSVSLTLSPIKDATGNLVGFSKIVRDISEQKRAEQALAEMTRKLIEAQEQERTRIGRELHDDINQQLALAVIELEQWNQEFPTSEVDIHRHIAHIRDRLSSLGRDVQALSHRLHSSKLDYLGLMVAAKSFCRELSEQQKVEIDFIHEGVPKNAPTEISLCLFRILQEALQNAIKYSGERHFTVKLEGTPTEIQLTITDRGVGFDKQAALSGRGLGLISMRERIQLVKGDLSITSHPNCGTTVYARVPFVAEDNLTSLAG